jgi:hypothetical protein
MDIGHHAAQVRFTTFRPTWVAWWPVDEAYDMELRRRASLSGVWEGVNLTHT